MTMKLWLLTAGHSFANGYDNATGFVVAAGTEVQARTIAAANGGCEQPGRCEMPFDGWLDPANATCVELSAEGREVGVILCDFNAG